MSRLCGLTLDVVLLDTRLVCMGSLSLENGGLLRRLGQDGLVWQLGTKLLLVSLWHALLLLGSLQDLRCHVARHAGILGLTLRELRLLLVLLLRIA